MNVHAIFAESVRVEVQCARATKAAWTDVRHGTRWREGEAIARPKSTKSPTIAPHDRMDREKWKL